MALKIRSLVIVALLVMLFSAVVNALDLPQNDASASPLLDRIAQGEGITYDAINSWYVQYTQSAAVEADTMGIPDFFRLSQTPLTEMTINDVMRFQEILQGLNINTPVGRYQVIDSTLIDLKNRYGLSGEEIFDAEMQDRLALALCGYDTWVAGAKTDSEDKAFLYRIAGTWSTVEDPYNPGKSRYDMDGNPCGSNLNIECQHVKTTSGELKTVMTQIKTTASESETNAAVAGYSMGTSIPEGSESSIVGRWNGYNEPNPPGSCEGAFAYIIDFNNDGTFTRSHRDSDRGLEIRTSEGKWIQYISKGKWIQNGHNILLQYDPRPMSETKCPDCEDSAYESETEGYTEEGAINGDIMIGTGSYSGRYHSKRIDEYGSFSCLYNWEAYKE